MSLFPHLEQPLSLALQLLQPFLEETGVEEPAVERLRQDLARAMGLSDDVAEQPRQPPPTAASAAAELPAKLAEPLRMADTAPRDKDQPTKQAPVEKISADASHNSDQPPATAAHALPPASQCPLQFRCHQLL